MWYIVLFPFENTVSIIPSSWYVEKSMECFWPPATMKKLDLDKYIKGKYLPDENWRPHKAKIMGKYGDYKEAQRKLAKAKNRDTLSSTDNEDIGRGKRKKFSQSFNNSSSASEADASASDDGLTYPSLSTLAAEKEEISSSFKVHEVAHSASNSNTTNLQQKLTILPNLNAHKRKSFYRNKSRSLSPELLSVKEKSPVQFKSVYNNPNPEYVHAEMNSNINTSKILGILEKMQTDESEFRVQVLRKLHLLNAKLNDIDASVQNISMNKEIQLQENVNNDEFQNLFPLDDKKLNNLEVLLENDMYKQKLIKYLSYVGGVDVAENVKRLMYKLLTNEIGQCFSWDGAKGKRQFKTLKIANIIFETVRENRNLKNATEAEIIMYIKKWLVRSKERIIVKNKNRQIQNEINHSDEVNIDE